MVQSGGGGRGLPAEGRAVGACGRLVGVEKVHGRGGGGEVGLILCCVLSLSLFCLLPLLSFFDSCSWFTLFLFCFIDLKY